MNALWITRICAYKNTPLSVITAKAIIDIKIDRRIKLLRRFDLTHSVIPNEPKNISGVLLFEAREARSYWKKFSSLLPKWAEFPGRKPRREDVTNRLLDIGYHHLSLKVSKLLIQHDTPPAIGLLHVARTSDSQPLVYDLMEMFRADLVESEVLRGLRLKKQPFTELRQRDIANFLHNVNERMNKRFYLRNFGQCHTYSYYMELQILKFS